MNGAPRATNGGLPTQLPWTALVMLVLATPLIAALLDPDPQNLASEWKDSGRSTLALLAFTIVNGVALMLTCRFALRMIRPRSVVAGALTCLLVVAIVTPLMLWLPLPAWGRLDSRLFSEPVVFMVRALLSAPHGSAWPGSPPRCGHHVNAKRCAHG